MELNFELQLHSFSGLTSLFGVIIATLLVFSDVEGETNSSHPNKNPVLTIVSEDGDIIDCVDIYKQPAFDHPSLKNHSVKMLPSFLPTTAEGNYLSIYPVQQLWQNSGFCPKETIPILRAPTTDLTTIQPNGEFSYCTVEVARLEMYLKKGEGPYIGASGTINAWDIRVEEREWSSNSVTVFNKQGSFMEIGWVVSPVLFEDQNPRLFVNWLDKSIDLGCFNLRCPGFIQVSSRVMLGLPLPNISVFDGQQFDYKFSIFKDPTHGIWWASYQGEALGYWPQSLFDDFEVIGYANWGGSVCNSMFRRSHTNTEMGSGAFAMHMYRRASYVRRILLLNKDRKFVNPKHAFLTVKCGYCYSAEFCKNFVDKLEEGKCIHYGGPGGRYCDAKCK